MYLIGIKTGCWPKRYSDCQNLLIFSNMDKKCLFLASHYRSKCDFGGQRSRYSAESFAKYFNEVRVVLPIVDTYSGNKVQKKLSQHRVNFSYVYTIQFDRHRLVQRFFSQLLYTFFISF